jgi:hypothetical protein
VMGLKRQHFSLDTEPYTVRSKPRTPQSRTQTLNPKPILRTSCFTNTTPRILNLTAQSPKVQALAAGMGRDHAERLNHLGPHPRVAFSRFPEPSNDLFSRLLQNFSPSFEPPFAYFFRAILMGVRIR